MAQATVWKASRPYGLWRCDASQTRTSTGVHTKYNITIKRCGVLVFLTLYDPVSWTNVRSRLCFRGGAGNISTDYRTVSLHNCVDSAPWMYRLQNSIAFPLDQVESVHAHTSHTPWYCIVSSSTGICRFTDRGRHDTEKIGLQTLTLAGAIIGYINQ